MDELIKIGDEVFVIPQENQDGKNPISDSAKATIIGFSEICYGRLGNLGFDPGVYVNRAWAKIRLGDGHEYMELGLRLQLTNKSEADQRLAEYRKWKQENPDNWRNKEFIRDLPETPFWEGDLVRVRGRSGVMTVLNQMPPKHDPEIFQIIGIEYHLLGEKTLVGTKYPAYKISDKIGAGWNTSANEDDMVLIERGPVWRFYHNEPIIFSDIEEEAIFFEQLGRVDEVRNPANGLFKWTKEEVLDAIRSGLVHGLSLSRTFFSDPSINAVRFRDEEVGKRVAKATLEGFSLQA